MSLLVNLAYSKNILHMLEYNEIVHRQEHNKG